MQKETVVKLCILSHEFHVNTVQGIFNEFRNLWGIEKKDVTITEDLDRPYITIKIISRMSNDTTNYEDLENKIQKELDELAMLKYKMELIRDDKS